MSALRKPLSTTTANDPLRNRQYLGNGWTRSCFKCGRHFPGTEGVMQHVMGKPQFFCKEHARVAKATKRTA